MGLSPPRSCSPGTETRLRPLTESLRDQARLRSLLHRLAYRLGSDPALIDVPHALVAVPGTRCERVHPTRTVHVETWEPTRQYAPPYAAHPREWRQQTRYGRPPFRQTGDKRDLAMSSRKLALLIATSPGLPIMPLRRRRYGSDETD